jgi:hypothetical protein
MAVMIYALYTYHWRAASIRRGGRGPYDDRFGKFCYTSKYPVWQALLPSGPTLLCIALLSKFCDVPEGSWLIVIKLPSSSTLFYGSRRRIRTCFSVIFLEADVVWQVNQRRHVEQQRPINLSSIYLPICHFSSLKMIRKDPDHRSWQISDPWHCTYVQ